MVPRFIWQNAKAFLEYPGEVDPSGGGRAFVLPFGTIYTPNITPDAETGIGKWTDAQFLNAVHRGIAPDGSRYYPAFPYPSYTLLTDEDTLAIKSYLFSGPSKS